MVFEGEAEIFGRAMTAKASLDVGAVTAAYDFTRFGRIMVMLTVTGGRERTTDQLGNLFDAAGFGLVRVIDTRSSIHIVEARAA